MVNQQPTLQTRIGMKREGVLRQRVRKWGQFEDVVLMALLREEWVNVLKR